jgi:hypothetical protein
MTLPSTGSLSLDTIRTNFGGAAGAVPINQYYRGGARVANVSTMNSSIPTSGAISIQNFRGAYVPTTTNMTLSRGTYSISDGQKSPTNYNYYGYNTSVINPGPFTGSGSAGVPVIGSLTNTTFTTFNGTFTIVSFLSADYGGNARVTYLTLSSSTLYATNDDASFVSALFPNVGTLTRSTASTYQQYLLSSVRYTRWQWSTPTVLVASGTAVRNNFA